MKSMVTELMKSIEQMWFEDWVIKCLWRKMYSNNGDEILLNFTRVVCMLNCAHYSSNFLVSHVLVWSKLCNFFKESK